MTQHPIALGPINLQRIPTLAASYRASGKSGLALIHETMSRLAQDCASPHF